MDLFQAAGSDSAVSSGLFFRASGAWVAGIATARAARVTRRSSTAWRLLSLMRTGVVARAVGVVASFFAWMAGESEPGSSSNSSAA